MMCHLFPENDLRRMRTLLSLGDRGGRYSSEGPRSLKSGSCVISSSFIRRLFVRVALLRCKLDASYDREFCKRNRSLYGLHAHVVGHGVCRGVCRELWLGNSLNSVAAAGGKVHQMSPVQRMG